MESDEYKAAHAEGVRKNEKAVRMYFPPDWGGPENYFVRCESQKKLCIAMNFLAGHVSQVIAGKRNHHKGFIFKWKQLTASPNLLLALTSLRKSQLEPLKKNQAKKR